ncbi:hypothetical protein [Nocardia phage NC1]|nr:hypothetical protein [Nocardia phage NC1]QSL67704.1 hypothetical protein [Nocardia phage P69]
MSDPTPEQIAKLPKHIQGYIRGLEHDRNKAISMHADLFAAQQAGPVTYHSELHIQDNPLYLQPGSFARDGADYSKVRFWMHGTRWAAPSRTRDYIEVGRGNSVSSRGEFLASQEDQLTIRAMDAARLVIVPSSSSEIILRHERW